MISKAQFRSIGSTPSAWTDALISRVVLLGGTLVLAACADARLPPVAPVQATEEVATEVKDADPHAAPRDEGNEGAEVESAPPGGP